MSEHTEKVVNIYSTKSEFNTIWDRIKLDSVIGYLIYGSETEPQKNGEYQSRIVNAYDEIFDVLEHIMPSVSRQDEDLFNAVMDFSIVHNEVYLEMGLLMGFQLYKEIEESRQKLDMGNMKTVLKKILADAEEMEKKNAT